MHVNLTTGQTEEVVERLLSGLIHIAICRLTQHPEFESIHLYNDKLRLVVPTNHPFVGKTAVTLTDAADEPFLFFDRNSSYHTLVYTMFLRAGVAPESVMEVDSMEVIKRMVERGLGIAVLPEVSVQDEVQRGDLATIQLAGTEQPVREVGLHVLRNRMMAPPIGDFLQLMAEHYGLDRTFEAGHTPAESR